MVQSFEAFAEALQKTEKKTRVALCCAEDLHALQGLAEARRRAIAQSVLIGNPEKIRVLLNQIGEPVSEYELIPAENATQAVAVAAELVHTNQAGVIMKGAMQTAELMHNVLRQENRLREAAVMSVCGTYQLPCESGGTRLLSLTDPALNIQPDLTKKKAILENAVRLRHALGNEMPAVAVIAANEVETPKMQETVDAAALRRMNQNGQIPGCVVEGPISLDLAVNPESAELKGYESPVAGRADLLVMPDLVSANVLAKSITDIAGCLTAGVVLGACVPIVLVSRASRASDKFYSLAVAAYASQHF